MTPEFTSLLESIASGVVVADKSGRIVFSNAFLETMFGYESGELLGQPVENLIPAELRNTHTRHREQYSLSPQTRAMGFGMDLSARRKNGSAFPVEVGLSHINTADGMKVVAIVTDITKRKQAEQRSLLQKDVALILSQGLSLQDVASRLLRSIGLTLGWHLGVFWIVDEERHVLRHVANWGDNSPGTEEMISTSRHRVFQRGEGIPGMAWETGRPAWLVEILSDPDFTRRHEAVTGGLRSALELPIGVNGQVLGVLEFFSRDIRSYDEVMTDIAHAVGSQIGQFIQRKRNEEELGLSEQRYRSLFENAAFGIFQSRVSGEIADANPAMVAMLGYDSIDEVLRLNLNHDVYRHPSERLKIITSSEASDRFEPVEVEWKTKAGGTIQVRLTGRNLRDKTGAIVGFEAIAEDISQRRLLEQEYRQAQKMEAVGRLAGGIAHDFNNLLTVISVSNDQLLEELRDMTSLHETLDQIAHASDRGASLVRQLMAFSRRQPENLELANLNEIVQRSERMLQILVGEDIELKLDLHEGECLTQAEGNQLEQILMNLVTNARDAMPLGGAIRVQTAVVDLEGDSLQTYIGLKPRKYVKLSVSDNGTGIPPEVLPHIFEPFFTTKETGKGTGLGLSTVYGIIRQYEGHVGCQSSNQGTTITMLLPALDGAARLGKTAEEFAQSEAGTETILLVEDEPALRKSVHRILVQNGYKVIAVSNGREALDLDVQAGFDLLLTDISLPQMKGTELAERLRKRIPGLKVLFMSGYAGDSSIEDALFMQKPFRREVLIRKVREILDAQPAESNY